MDLKAVGICRDFFRKSGDTNVFRAVEPTDLTIKGGRMTAVTGRSGSGKTTLINMLAGVLTPTSGNVLLGGDDLYKLDDRGRSRLRNRLIGVVPQGQTALGGLTVMENVLIPAQMYGRADSDTEKRAHELLGEMGIAELEQVYAGELSGGELRRMAIARALVNRPEIVIADEPTGDLDDEMTERVLALFGRLCESGAAVLMVTHEAEAAARADVCYRMNKGTLTLCEKMN